MDQHIIDEYTAQHAIWRKGGRLNIGRRSSRRDETEYLARLRAHIPFITFKDGRGTYKVLALPGRADAITKKLRAALKIESGAQYFAALRRDQFRTTARKEDREGAEKCRDFDIWTEPEPAYTPCYADFEFMAA